MRLYLLPLKGLTKLRGGNICIVHIWGVGDQNENGTGTSHCKRTSQATPQRAIAHFTHVVSRYSNLLAQKSVYIKKVQLSKFGLGQATWQTSNYTTLWEMSLAING